MDNLEQFIRVNNGLTDTQKAGLISTLVGVGSLDPSNFKVIDKENWCTYLSDYKNPSAAIKHYRENGVDHE